MEIAEDVGEERGEPVGREVEHLHLLVAQPVERAVGRHLAAQQVRLHLRVGDAARRRRDPQLDEEDDEPVGEERRELGAGEYGVRGAENKIGR